MYRTEETDFLLGTGAGSFGHFTAHQYGLRDGAQTAKQAYGMSLTHNAVARLSNLMASELIGRHVPVFTLSPAAFITCYEGQIASTYLDPVRNLLAQAIVPVVHGDTISDAQRGTTILSTERVLDICAQQLRAEYGQMTVIYMLDVDGLLDKNGRVIPQLAPDDDITAYTNLAHDVTGGIVGKVESARRAAQQADAVYLIGGKTSGALRQAIAGKTVGTRILG
jgi:isopentenyl phosphate kinase